MAEVLRWRKRYIDSIKLRDSLLHFFSSFTRKPFTFIIVYLMLRDNVFLEVFMLSSIPRDILHVHEHTVLLVL